MSFTLYLDKERWYNHQRQLDKLYPDYLPVIKGNGYGFGNSYLAKTCLALGKDKVAVGTLQEARSMINKGYEFEEILVLTPVLGELRLVDFANCVFTVGSIRHLEHLMYNAEGLLSFSRKKMPIIKVVLKCQSTMRRYGFSPEELATAIKMLADEARILPLEIKGYSIHLPVEGPSETEKFNEVTGWLGCIAKNGLKLKNMYLTHIAPETLQQLAATYPTMKFIARLGTTLWLSEKPAYRFCTTVLAVQQIQRGETFGYKQKKARRNGYLLYVAGGSANGVGLETPLHMKKTYNRLRLTVFWVLNLFNLNLSPFTYRGKRMWFAEPPHMQTTALWLPAGMKPPAVGSEIEIKNLRMTIAVFDRIVDIDPDNQVTQIYRRTVGRDRIHNNEVNKVPARSRIPLKQN